MSTDTKSKKNWKTDPKNAGVVLGSPAYFEPRQKTKSGTRKHPRCSIKFDIISAADFRRYNFMYCCEQCSHFDPERKACTLGYNSKWHQREAQLRQFELAGSMALCRFLEID